MQHIDTIRFALVKIAESLNGKIHKEDEKRMKLDKLPEKTKGIEPSHIQQGVLFEAKDGDKVVAYARVRMKKDPGKPVRYSLGVKHFPRKEESGTEISKAMFDAFYPKLKKTQDKMRYHTKDGWDIDDIKGGGIVAEFEKTASRKHLYHYFDFADVKNMIDNGGIIARVRDSSKPTISTTYKASRTSYLRNMTGGRKGLLRMRIPKKEVSKSNDIQKFTHPIHSQGGSEYEKLIIPRQGRKVYGMPGAVLPWKYVDRVEVMDRAGLKNAIRSVPSFISSNPRGDLSALSKIIKSQRVQ